MTRTLWAVLCLALLAPRGAVAAELVRDLYIADVPVSDRSSAELARASAEGLAQVLVKVAGSAEVLALPPVVEAVGGARARVLQYSYARVDPPTPGASPGLAARVEFDPVQVRELLASAGAPIWTATRPVVLVWLVVEDEAGRRFVNTGTHPELVTGLADGFRRRGVPVRFPLFDLADTTALDPDEAWSLPAPLLIAASARYGAAEILAGRIAVLTSGEIAGEWAYFSVTGRQGRSVVRAADDEFLRQGVAMVVEDMASRYALTVAGGAGDGLQMTVAGVASYADYTAVLSWLEGLEPIARAQVTAISGDTLSLVLTADADAAQLAGVIELNPRLRPRNGSPTNGLSYQWRN
ncbi:MAG: DUF2066 domain-containing protein [Haliea sp.]|uniref:DUF2066 domain-containing protein n=1 Tax=Haliea sp. TaxID=1932666 RepID=UPI0032EAB51F